MHLAVVPLVVALTLTVSSGARAIYLTPDLVEIPTERLVTNLEQALATAPPEGRFGVLLQLARIHAAAYAHKRQGMAVLNPVHTTLGPPVVKGALDERAIHEGLSPMYGRGGNMLASLRRAAPEDSSYGCDPRALEGLLALDGEVRITLRVPKGKGDMVAPTAVKVASQTVKAPALAPCLASKVAAHARFPGLSKPSDVTLTFAFETTGPADQAFFGFGEVTVPRDVQPAPSEEVAAAAKKHLEAAREHYWQALQATPESALAHLGLAWTLEQLGLVDKAIACYRKTFVVAWKQEQGLMMLRLGQQPIAAEAAGYLLPHLDKDKDAAEIAELEAAIMKLGRLPRPVTPIVVPLDGGTTTLAELVDGDAAVPFDLDGSGLRRAWGWIRPTAAWLVWDPSGRGHITSGLQLFGGVSFWAFWQDGYAPLAALDDDHDGTLAEGELAGLALWHDVDGDGTSDAGEVRPVTAWGIRALATRATVDAAGVPHAARGVVMADGTTRPTWDWAPLGATMESR